MHIDDEIGGKSKLNSGMVADPKPTRHKIHPPLGNAKYFPIDDPIDF